MCGNTRHRRAHNNYVEGRFLDTSEGAIAEPAATLLAPTLCRMMRARSYRCGILSMVMTCAATRQHRGLVTAAGADFEHALDAAELGDFASSATIYGCEMVWSAPIGSGPSS